jgi:hypothetical protein
VLTPQKVKPSSDLIPIDWAVKFDENRPKVLTSQASNNSDHIKSLDDGVVRLTLRSRRLDEDQGRMVYPLQSISMITRVRPVELDAERKKKKKILNRHVAASQYATKKIIKNKDRGVQAVACMQRMSGHSKFPSKKKINKKKVGV